MANDRAFIVCEKCLEVSFIAKHYPSCPNVEPQEIEALVGFYTDHMERCYAHVLDFGDGDLFSIMGEDEYCARGGIIQRSPLPKLNPTPQPDPKGPTK